MLISRYLQDSNSYLSCAAQRVLKSVKNYNYVKIQAEVCMFTQINRRGLNFASVIIDDVGCSPLHQCPRYAYRCQGSRACRKRSVSIQGVTLHYMICDRGRIHYLPRCHTGLFRIVSSSLCRFVCSMAMLTYGNKIEELVTRATFETTNYPRRPWDRYTAPNSKCIGAERAEHPPPTPPPPPPPHTHTHTHTKKKNSSL